MSSKARSQLLGMKAPYSLFLLVLVAAALGVVAVSGTVADSGYPGYSRPPSSTRRVLLISVDGLHESDLKQWVADNPDCHLAHLSRHGIIYSNARVDGITDSFPGLLALVTGGNIAAHNVYYDDSYDRGLYPPGTTCDPKTGPSNPAGTEVLYDESIDINPDCLDGGGGAGVNAIDPKKLPTDGTCQPVLPGQFVQVNNIFECVVSKMGGYTAWADKHPAYGSLLAGPSTTGLKEFCGPEINSKYIGSADGLSWVDNALWTQQYDSLHVNAALNWIKGRTWTNQPAPQGPPILFGFNMQSVSVAQKLPGPGPGLPAPSGTGGYNPDGSFQPNMQSAMQFVDDSIGELVHALKKNDLYDGTTIIISAKHGQAPIDHATMKKVLPKDLEDTLQKAGIEWAQITADDVALIWLKDRSQTEAAVKALADNKDALRIKDLIYGQRLVDLGLAKSVDDKRAPQIIIDVVPGTIYTKSAKKVAEHGGLNEDDKHVALLVSGGGLPAASGCMGVVVDDPVLTRQVAPTILQLLGIEPSCLQAVQLQGTQVLPALFETDVCYQEGPEKGPEDLVDKDMHHEKEAYDQGEGSYKDGDYYKRGHGRNDGDYSKHQHTVARRRYRSHYNQQVQA